MQDYQAFVTATGRNWEKPSFDQGPTHPAVNVSWEDAKAFCAWLTKKEQEAGKIGANQKYRLPTDAEWSVAMGLGVEPGNTPEERHGKIKDVYPWGNQWPPLQGAGNYDGSLKVDKFKYTSPVGSFTANPVGLFDMGGNVWEWCEDSYRLGDDWRLLRGASWLDDYPFYLLSSYRSHFDPGNPSVIIGFRCVLVVGGASSSSR